ncbi:hypothetical protein Droror1_Dr00023536, partial [Drosera rotundifolia]
MVFGLAQSGCFEDALVCFMELRENRVEVNEACLTGVFSACAQVGEFQDKEKLDPALVGCGRLERLSLKWGMEVTDLGIDLVKRVNAEFFYRCMMSWFWKLILLSLKKLILRTNWELDNCGSVGGCGAYGWESWGYGSGGGTAATAATVDGVE